MRSFSRRRARSTPCRSREEAAARAADEQLEATAGHRGAGTILRTSHAPPSTLLPLAALLAAALARLRRQRPGPRRGRAAGRARRVPRSSPRTTSRGRPAADRRHNVGRLTHNLKVVRLDEEDREAPPTELGGTGTAQPGETATFTFQNLKPGEYRVVCTITNHDDLGQYGKLIVERRKEGG
jgi:hypothetical protein